MIARFCANFFWVVDQDIGYGVKAGPWVIKSSRILGRSRVNFATGYSEDSEGSEAIDGQTCEPRHIVSLISYM
jgi:hypothetical protein